MLAAGKLNRLVTIQSRSTTQDNHGQEIDSWVDVAVDVWAGIRPVGGNEQLRAMSLGNKLSHVVTVRYRAEFSKSIELGALRILYGTRIFNITVARNLDEANKIMLFDCVEGSLSGQ